MQSCLIKENKNSFIKYIHLWYFKEHALNTEHQQIKRKKETFCIKWNSAVKLTLQSQMLVWMSVFILHPSSFILFMKLTFSNFVLIFAGLH